MKDKGFPKLHIVTSREKKEKANCNFHLGSTFQNQLRKFLERITHTKHKHLEV